LLLHLLIQQRVTHKHARDRRRTYAIFSTQACLMLELLHRGAIMCGRGWSMLSVLICLQPGGCKTAADSWEGPHAVLAWSQARQHCCLLDSHLTPCGWFNTSLVGAVPCHGDNAKYGDSSAACIDYPCTTVHKLACWSNLLL